MVNRYPDLNPNKALIWRIVHRDNLPWILDNGMHCGNSSVSSSTWVHIGNRELIGKRASYSVPLPPGGFLNDYVPFYFTPFSPMLYNLSTGRGDVKKRQNEEILMLVSSLWRIDGLKLRYLFTDSHAYSQLANFYSDPKDLDKIDWQLLQSRNFKRNTEDLAKFECYQAEALIYQHLPVVGLLGIICYTKSLQREIERQIHSRALTFPVHARTGWYF
jgi:hypothetical protein